MNCPTCGTEDVRFVHSGGDAYGRTEPAPEGTITLSCRCSMHRDVWLKAGGTLIGVVTSFTPTDRKVEPIRELSPQIVNAFLPGRVTSRFPTLSMGSKVEAPPKCSICEENDKP